MSWFRSKLRSCTRLALFALAVQMAVSFGHVHLDDSACRRGRAGHPQFTSTAVHAPEGPADQDHHPAPDDYCPICASIALVGTGLPALPPVLIAPASAIRVRPPFAAPRSLSIQVASSFQARAPPLS